MSKKKNQTLTCPECKGTGGEMVDGLTNTFYQPCYYCAGYGFQTDEDNTYEQFGR